jgi:translation initiation factor IF-3
VRLVGSDGSQIGIVSTQEALRRAQELDLDLVEVAPQANPPVARIMDYGKFKYERDIRQKEARKKQVRVEVKEIKFRPKIDRHDYDTKKGHVVRFLSAGARVKVTIMFRGREMAHTDLGRKILDRLVEDLGDTAVVEAQPKQDGRNMVMVIGPTKKAMEQRAEASKRALGSAEVRSPEPLEEPSGPDAVDEAPDAVDEAPDAVDEAPDAEEAPDAVEEATALEQPEAPGSVEGPQPATR